MSIDLDSAAPTSSGQYEQYRALSTAAVAGLIVGLLSILALLDWILLPIPFLGLSLSLLALQRIRKHSDELTGEGIARAGLAFSIFFLIAGPARLTYVYITEVPEGYQRVSYAELQPDDTKKGELIPPLANELEGKKIFIKGYVYPGQKRFGIQKFLLVRDQGDCCFGGNPRITDRIEVTLAEPLKLDFEPRMFKVAGTFHVQEIKTAIDAEKGGVFYHLTADHLE